MSVDQNTLLLGKLLGEIYRVQSRSHTPCGASQERIYGLLNGFETEIERELEKIGFVSQEQVHSASKVLNAICEDPKKLAEFKGYYDIEADLEREGVDRGTAIRIFTYFAAGHRFTEIIEKMKTPGGSPIECQEFEVDETDK